MSPTRRSRASRRRTPRWFRGESIEYVERVLLTHDGALFEYLDRATVHALVSQHLSGAENRRLLIWSLLYFEQWIGEFLA